MWSVCLAPSFWATLCGGQTVWPHFFFLTVSTKGWTNCFATIYFPNCLYKRVDRLFGHLCLATVAVQFGVQTVWPPVFAQSGCTIQWTDCLATSGWTNWLYNLVGKLFGHSFFCQEAPQFEGQTVRPPIKSQMVSQNRWSNCMATSFVAMSLPKLVARLFDLILMTFEMGPSGGQTVCH